MAEILFGEIDDKLWNSEESDIELFLGKEIADISKDIEKNGKLDIITNRPGRLEVEICEPGELLPYLVKLVRKEENWFWDCDCCCNYPCGHLGSVLLRSAAGGLIKIFSRKEFQEKDTEDDPELLFKKIDEARKSIVENGGEVKELHLESSDQKYLELDGKSEGTKKNDPEEKGVRVLVFTVSRGSDGVNRIAPGALNLKKNMKPGKLEELFYPDRLTEKISPEEELLLDKIKASYSKEIPLLPEIFYFLGGRAKLYLESEKKIIVFNENYYLKIGFSFSGILKNDDLEFCPVFSPLERAENESGNEEYGTGEIYITGEHIFCINTEKSVIEYLKCDPDSRFMLSMIKQSYKRISSAEINRVKALAAGRNPERIIFDFLLEKAEVISSPPQPVLKMYCGSRECRVSFWFRYGVQEIHHSSGVKHLFGGYEDDGKVIILQRRNRDFEGLLMEAVRAGVSEDTAVEAGPYNRFFMDDDYDLALNLGINEFFSNYAPFLMEKEIELRINGRRLIQAPSVSYNVKIDQDWFDIKLEFPGDDGEIVIEDDLIESNIIRRGDSYIILTTEDIQELVKLQKMGMDAKGFLKTSSDNLGVIDLIYEKTLEKENLLNEKKEIIDHLKNFSDQKEPLPEGLQVQLRKYQEDGYQRLTFWHRYHLNGCLADDMGLGKTVQTLAHLQRLKETGLMTVSLLIAPVVTIPNWEAEISRFTPGIKVYRHAGTRRLKSWKKGRSYDLVIVSYNTLRNDVEFFSEIEFDYVILDEAHYVKNAASQTFKAIRALKSRHRLSLTGTPLENNTMELWTQMNFLNPWLLGPVKDFRNSYARPIEKTGDQGAADTLRAMISPFLLRRRKEEVLSELPPKEEIILYSEMGEEQAETYNLLKKVFRQKVLDLLDSGEKKKSTVEILSFMLKLRQAALLPALVDRKYGEIPSCKMDSLFLLLGEVLSENHKVLVFSQFTSVIDYLENYCRQNRMKYVTLTGSTRDRAEPVRKFQEDDDIRIFLLSLKAGGVGINLTAADYVVLFDPWWNPAAEAQAVDRAHRMGQKRKVFTYRIITRNTIEEKIMALQQRKKELADNLISDTGGSFSSMDRDDILNLFQ